MRGLPSVALFGPEVRCGHKRWKPEAPLHCTMRGTFTPRYTSALALARGKQSPAGERSEGQPSRHPIRSQKVFLRELGSMTSEMNFHQALEGHRSCRGLSAIAHRQSLTQRAGGGLDVLLVGLSEGSHRAVTIPRLGAGAQGLQPSKLHHAPQPHQ